MPELNGIRASDLWGVPFDGESTLGWPGSRYAPERVRQRAGWINMRIKDGRIYQLETDTIHEGGESLLFPIARGVHDTLPGRIGIVHFDAHLDLLDESPGQGRLSQSSGMRRALELDRIAPTDCIQLCERHFNFPASGAFKKQHGLVHLS